MKDVLKAVALFALPQFVVAVAFCLYYAHSMGAL